MMDQQETIVAMVDEAEHCLYIWDLQHSTHKLLSTIGKKGHAGSKKGEFAWPKSIAITIPNPNQSQFQRLYVSDWGNKRIQHFSLDNYTFDGQLFIPDGKPEIICTHLQYLAVTIYNEHIPSYHIHIYNIYQDHQHVKTLQSITNNHMKQPQGMAFVFPTETHSYYRYLIVSDNNEENHRIMIIDFEADTILLTIGGSMNNNSLNNYSPGYLLSSPSGIAIDHEKDAFVVVDKDNHCIKYFQLSTFQYLGKIHEHCYQPYAISIGKTKMIISNENMKGDKFLQIFRRDEW
jgi:hypothetical protein